MYKIITHPGSSHKDDFLATSVLLATLGDAAVLRREPTPADMADVNTYVVDVGFEHAPERRNFDHHQDRSLPCAFHLVMQHLGHHEAAMEMFAWYRHMSMMDVRGPYRTANHLGVDTSVLFAASSPIDGYILSTFARAEALDRDDPLYQLMKALGRDMIDLIDRKTKRPEQLKAEARVVPVKHLKKVSSSATTPSSTSGRSPTIPKYILSTAAAFWLKPVAACRCSRPSNWPAGRSARRRRPVPPRAAGPRVILTAASPPLKFETRHQRPVPGRA